MKKELTPNEIIFSRAIKESFENTKINITPKITTTFNKMRKALNIEKDCYNVYYVDSFSKEKIDNLIKYIEKIYENRKAPQDICYVTSENILAPSTLFLPAGKGSLLKEMLEDVKDNYFNCAVDFYNASSENEKESILGEINEKRSEYINKLMEMAKAKNFEVKATNGGFVFIPLKDQGEEMSQEEYDDLESEDQDTIEKQASKLKKEAEDILEKLKNMELSAIGKIKDIYREHIKNYMQKEKDDLLLDFISEDGAYRYLVEMFESIEDELIECYTINLEDDEDTIQGIFSKYQINILVDNYEKNHPNVIYEEDPTIGNLIGNIEYKNNNGSYSTDVSLINAGSLLKANEGCLILRVSSLLNSGSSYYYLKKALLHGKVDYNYTRSYLEVLSIAGLKPESIPINVKVILIGDYESFEILYERDEDFKRIFPLIIEADTELKYDEAVKDSIISLIKEKIKTENLLNISNEAISEIIKYLSRIVGERGKISIDDYHINRLLYLSNNNAKIDGRENIEKKDIIDIGYEEQKILDNVMESYRNKKILITTIGEKVGIINALSVVGNSVYSFGKPMRVTCLALQGEGRIIDIHKECNLSGSIHEKSISILRGLLSNLISPYEKLPIDFQLSFEQTYGMIEGDSASVAEIVCILSALSKRPIRQNIAVTGSINQFGEIQPIGGVNEKIEGFYKVCSIIDSIENKGVLIPSINKNELILMSDVEDSVKNNKFHIFTMETLEDALEVLILEEGESLKGFFKEIEDEISKYKNNKKKK